MSNSFPDVSLTRDREQEQPPCESSDCCCMIGPGGKWRLALYIAGGVVLLGLIVYGFVSA